MTNVYRISKAKYIRDLTGTGARLYGGRWNPRGHAVLYTAENKSLAALEFLVHVDQHTIPKDLKILTIKIPKNTLEVFSTRRFNKINTLPDAKIQFQELGKEWLIGQSSLVLQVPSILIPGESNLLINPLHPDFKKLKITKEEDFLLDERFFI